MKYSFVLPAYKATYFKEAIDSILNQTYKEFELIIVNDASPEELDSIVLSYEDPRIRYYKNEKNIGGEDLVAQWNHSISYAQGEYIILASDDDVYHLDYLEKMDSIIEKYPDVNVFRPMVQMINFNGEITHIRGLLNEYSSQLIFAYFSGRIGGGVPFYIFRRKTLESIHGFKHYPLAWHSDDMTALMMADKGIVFYPEILFSFRLSGESISSKQNNVNTLRMKIEATNQYIDDLCGLLSSIESHSDIEEFCRTNLIQSLPSYKKAYLQDWFWSSTKKAVVKNYSLFKESNCFTIKTLLLMYIRRLLLTMGKA